MIKTIVKGIVIAAVARQVGKYIMKKAKDSREEAAA